MFWAFISWKKATNFFSLKNIQMEEEIKMVQYKDVDFSSPKDTSKTHLYVEHFYLKLTENWQKDSCTTKAIRNIHM